MYYRQKNTRDSDESMTIDQKIDTYGPSFLRDGELLMVSIDVTEEQINNHFSENTLQILHTWDLNELEDQFGKLPARRLACILELSRRFNDYLSPISFPQEIMALLANFKDAQKEHFLGLYLNARNQVLLTEVISIGCLTSTIVHPREVFLPAIRTSSASIILAHNHPSGDVKPSEEDVNMTRRLINAGGILGIEILDHIVIGPSSYFSMKEDGII